LTIACFFPSDADASFHLYFIGSLWHRPPEFLAIQGEVVKEMKNLECPQCGGALANGAAVCGSCGKEVKALPLRDRQQELGRRNVYAILAVVLVLLGGAALLIFTGLLSNPLKGSGSTTVAIVNGEKITMAEVNQHIDVYKRVYGQGGKMDFTNPEGKKALDDMRKNILDTLIQERILVTEAVKENISVPPQMIAERIASAKKTLNLSDQGFDDYLRKQGMSLSDFTKRLERQVLMTQLIAKGVQEKGLTREAWVKELTARATVQVFYKEN
jgi:hypothetical protein